MIEPKQRRLLILAAIVESYVETGEPVGSKTLADALYNTVSSATIRNDMASLTSVGYLEQPHTSAGRIPTQRGYRLYVDHLMGRRSLPQDVMRDIDMQLSGYSMDPLCFLEDASRMLSDMTGLAAVTTAPANDDARIVNIELMQVGPHTCLLIMMFSPAVLKSRICRLETELDDDTLQMLKTILREALCQKRASELNRRLITEIKQRLGEAGRYFEPLLSAARDAANDTASVQVVMSGTAHLLDRGDLSETSARDVLNFLSDRKRVSKLISSGKGGMSVLIGHELPHSELSNASIITARYRGSEQSAGWVGVIGPTRMNYAGIIPRIEYFATAVGRLMSAIEISEDV